MRSPRGIIAQIIRQGLVDKDWVEKHTVGFPELAARAAEFTPDYVEEVTGVPVGDVARFAREFASIQPSVIRLGVALERHAGSGQTIRAVCAIPALTGSWRHVSGGLLQMPLWEFPSIGRACRGQTSFALAHAWSTIFSSAGRSLAT